MTVLFRSRSRLFDLGAVVVPAWEHAHCWAEGTQRRERDVAATDMVELAHLVGQAVFLGPAGGDSLRRILPRSDEELAESTLRFEVAANHDRVVRLERL